MKISNIITTGVLALFAGGAIGFGVYAITRPTDYINNNISYVLNSEKCFVEVNGRYQGPELLNGQDTHNTKYDKESLMKGKSAELTSWNIGHVILSESEPSFTLTIEITNLAESEDAHDLSVKVSNIAYDNATYGSARFSTTCKLDETQKDLIPYDSTSAYLSTFTIEAGKTTKLEITYKVEKFNEEIDTFYNNIKIEFGID